MSTPPSLTDVAALETIASRLKTGRLALEINQRQLAKRADVSHSLISVLESGKRDTVGLSAGTKIAEVLNVSYSWLTCEPGAIKERHASPRGGEMPNPAGMTEQQQRWQSQLEDEDFRLTPVDDQAAEMHERWLREQADRTLGDGDDDYIVEREEEYREQLKELAEDLYHAVKVMRSLKLPETKVNAMLEATKLFFNLSARDDDFHGQMTQIVIALG